MKRIPDHIQEKIWTYLIVISMIGFLFGMSIWMGGK
jgi:hypothetical protein